MSAHHQVISEYLQNAEKPTLADFVKSEQEYIVQHTAQGEDPVMIWSTRFCAIAKRKGVVIRNSKPDWGTVALQILRKAQPNVARSSSDCEAAHTITDYETASNITHSTPNSTDSSNTTSSSRSTSLSVKLTPEQRRWFTATHDSMKQEKKWKLGEKFVEDEIAKFANQCNYEHPCHSFILDPYDAHWLNCFSVEELKHLKTYKAPSLAPLPHDINDYLYSFVGKQDIELLYTHTSMKIFHPIKDPDLHWIQKTMVEALDLFFYKLLPLTDQSEADILRRVWHFLEKCFDPVSVKVRCGEKASAASSSRMNTDRLISGVEKISRKAYGHKVDMLFSYLQQEYGCAEAGLDGEITGTKAVVEGGVKLPCLMKDMFYQLANDSPSKVREIRVAGFLISGMNFTVLIMDCPDGYVCRTSKIGPLKFPSSVEEFSKKIVPLITIICQVRNMMKATIEAIESDTSIIIPTINSSSTSPIPPSLPPPIKYQRKRKIAETDL